MNEEQLIQYLRDNLYITINEESRWSPSTMVQIKVMLKDHVIIEEEHEVDYSMDLENL